MKKGTLLLRIFGLSKKEELIEAVKEDIKKESRACTLKIKRMNKAIASSGVTLDIANSIGIVNNNGKGKKK